MRARSEAEGQTLKSDYQKPGPHCETNYVERMGTLVKKYQVRKGKENCFSFVLLSAAVATYGALW